MGNTLIKYSVKLYCTIYDRLVGGYVAAENPTMAFQIAEDQHNAVCRSWGRLFGGDCNAEGETSTEGWE